ncbi:hypothetical protein KP509_37G061800 [Ceratopteris richardii]|nr:hypothetical protein KP509_37G061800 [Ceratopteris richardii]
MVNKQSKGRQRPSGAGHRIKSGRLRFRFRRVSRLRLKRLLSPLWLLKKLILIYASLLNVPGNDHVKPPHLIMGLHWAHPLAHF